MIQKNSNSSKFTMELQADTGPGVNEYFFFSQSECFVRLARQDAQKLSLYVFAFYGTVSGVTTLLGTSQIYYSDAAGRLDLPMRRWLKTYAPMTDDGEVRITYSLNETNGTAVDTGDFTATVLPGISDNELPMPYTKDSLTLPGTARNYILPPNVILAPWMTNVSLIVEADIQDYGNGVWKDGNNATITPTGARGNQLEISSAYKCDLIKLRMLTKTQVWRLTGASSDCINQVLVRWTSLTGATRQHVFNALAFSREWDGEGLLSSGDGIRSEKNTALAVRCQLTGLTAYGYWYYMDLLSANDVHAVMLNDNLTVLERTDLILSPFSCATVDGGTPETPTGPGFYNFEFTIKIRHYDTF